MHDYDEDCNLPLFPDRRELRLEPLPLTVSGLQILFSDLVTEVAATVYGPIASETSCAAFEAYSRQRLPGVFQDDSAARGVLVTSIREVVDAVHESELPDRRITWPFNPLWVAHIVDRIVTRLVSRLAACNIYIPGSTAQLERTESSQLPKVDVAVEDDGTTYTMVCPRLTSTRSCNVDFTMHYHRGALHFGKRARGSNVVERIATVPEEGVPALRALLEWHAVNPNLGR